MTTAQLITSLIEEHLPANILIIGRAGSGKSIVASAILAGPIVPVIIEAQSERQLPPGCLVGAAAIIMLRVADKETAESLSMYTGGRMGADEIMGLPDLVGYFVVPDTDPVKLELRGCCRGKNLFP